MTSPDRLLALVGGVDLKSKSIPPTGVEFCGRGLNSHYEFSKHSQTPRILETLVMNPPSTRKHARMLRKPALLGGLFAVVTALAPAQAADTATSAPSRDSGRIKPKSKPC
jgi:hypothetical protein